MLIRLLLGMVASIAQGQVFGMPATITINPHKEIGKVSSDFLGLSYEAANLGNPDTFSPENKALIRIFRLLSPHGILRIGGNTSEYTVWQPGARKTTDYAGDEVFRDINTHAKTILTPKSFRNLDGFLKATGWKLVYGVNLGTAKPEVAADEIATLAQIVGPRLMAVQIGNEPDLFSSNGLRDKTYAFGDFYKEWRAFYSAIKLRSPEVAIAGPDTCWDWVPTFVEKIQPNEVRFLSSHFYWTGPPTDPKVQVDTLLQPNGWFDYNMKRDMEASKASGLPFRNTEGNSCYRGGKDGVSNVYASALWATDYCLQLAKWGAAGATFHSGGVANYSPIAGDAAKGYEIRPEFYGLLLVSNLQGAKLVESEFKCDGVNASAYAFLAGRKRKVVVVNKDRTQSVDLRLDVQGSASVSRLMGSSLDSKTGTTYRGALVSGTGGWKPAKGEKLEAVAGTLTVTVPAASAAVIEF